MSHDDISRGYSFYESRPVGCLQATCVPHGIDIFLTITITVFALILSQVSPRNRFFHEQNLELSYPYIESSIPEWILCLVLVVVPATCICWVVLYLRWKDQETMYSADLTRAMLFIWQSISISFLCKTILALVIGRHRPNFFSMCDYSGFREMEKTGNSSAYFNLTHYGHKGDLINCRDTSNLNYARSSFPSLVASISFSALGSLTIFFYCLLNFKQHTKMMKMLIVILPIFVATLVSSKGIWEYWHHFDDVLAGVFIGCGSTYLAYMANYNNSSNERPHPLIMSPLASRN